MNQTQNLEATKKVSVTYRLSQSKNRESIRLEEPEVPEED